VQVIEGAAAARAGVQIGDLLLAVDGVAVEDATDLQRLMVDERIGREVELRVLRGGREQSLTVVPEELVG
jgi:S1-C subfamily serine protease